MGNNICMVVLSEYPFDPRVRRQAEILEKNGYNIDIICLRDKGQLKSERLGNVAVYRVRKSITKENIIKYMWLSLSFFILSFFKIQQLYFKKRYKLIEVHNMPDFLVFTGVIQKIMGRKIILDMHDMTVELYETKWATRDKSVILKLIRLVEKISCSFADHVITVTEACRKLLVSRGVQDNKVTLVLNTANGSIFKYNGERKFNKIESNAKLLYHGTVAERFGIHTVIKAIPLIQQKIPFSTLQIYGKYEPNYRKTLEAIIKELNIEAFVFLNGTKTLEEIYEIINTCDIGVVPYMDDSYMNIALSTKAFEYVASGLPVVASRLQALSEIFDDCSLGYFKPGDVSGLAESIIELCSNPAKRCQNSQNANEAIQKISGEVMGMRYLELIKIFTR